jgi:hypothetical protein
MALDVKKQRLEMTPRVEKQCVRVQELPLSGRGLRYTWPA